MWAALAFGLVFMASIVDLVISHRRINKYGIAVELNPSVRFLIKKIGLKKGLFLGIVPLSLLFAGTFFAMGWSEALGFYTGWKMMYFVQQMESLRLEGQYDIKLEDKE